MAPDLDPNTLQGSINAHQINLKLHFYRCEKEYLEVFTNPPHGYGKNINPCIDCHIFFLKKAAEYMEEIDADFIATGEVVGQRPMSQLKNMLIHIERASDLEGRLIRPLSAKILNPTIPEQEGLIDREKLYDISGRSRKQQFKLAKQFGIEEYASPAGGCLFTDEYYAAKAKDLLLHNPDCDSVDLYLLTLGRHFRVDETTKIIIPRNEKENIELEKYKEKADNILIPDFKGPLAFFTGNLTDENERLISSIISKYGSPTESDNIIRVFTKDLELKEIIAQDPISLEKLDQLRI